MSSSREESPDWLRTFQAPTQSVLTLSSGSESSPNDSPLREDGTNEKKPSSSKETSQFTEKDEDQDTSLCGRGDESASKKTLKAKSPTKKGPKVEHTSVKKKKTDNRSKPGNDIKNGSDEKAAKQEKSEKHIEPNVPNNSVLTLSSDSESPHSSPIREGSKGKSPKRGLKNKDPVSAKKKKVNSDINKKENNGDVEVAEEEIAEKHTEPHVRSFISHSKDCLYLLFTTSPWGYINYSSPPQGCLWCSLRKLAVQRYAHLLFDFFIMVSLFLPLFKI
ncbi:hypothetical protein CsSME_00002139 [Camellia sinensis var. sinensis]